MPRDQAGTSGYRSMPTKLRNGHETASLGQRSIPTQVWTGTWEHYLAERHRTFPDTSRRYTGVAQIRLGDAHTHGAGDPPGPGQRRPGSSGPSPRVLKGVRGDGTGYVLS